MTQAPRAAVVTGVSERYPRDVSHLCTAVAFSSIERSVV